MIHTRYFIQIRYISSADTVGAFLNSFLSVYEDGCTALRLLKRNKDWHSMTMRAQCNLSKLEQQIVGPNVSICVKHNYMRRKVWAAAVKLVANSSHSATQYVHSDRGWQDTELQFACDNRRPATQPTMSNICPTIVKGMNCKVLEWKRETKEIDQRTRENFKMDLKTNRMTWIEMDWSGTG